jgi:transcriptional regulator with XRE-family HTH domain
MARRPRKTHDQYLRESIERDPELAALYEETRLETELAFALTAYFEEHTITQRALADESGIAQPMINRIARGNQVPTVTTLYRLMRALNATAEIGPKRISIRPATPAAASASVQYHHAAGFLEQALVSPSSPPLPRVLYGYESLISGFVNPQQVAQPSERQLFAWNFTLPPPNPYILASTGISVSYQGSGEVPNIGESLLRWTQAPAQEYAAFQPYGVYADALATYPSPGGWETVKAELPVLHAHDLIRGPQDEPQRQRAWEQSAVPQQQKVA